jgi:hypothetical protein
MNNIFKKS